MILPAGLLLLPFVLAKVGFWDCLTGTELDNLGFFDRVYCCYAKSRIPDDYDYDYDYDNYDRPYFDDGPEYRLSTGSGAGSIITCWPSKGGICKLDNIHIVQRQFLGLDRRVTNLLRPEVSIEVEDAFCNQLRNLGARWWGNEWERKYGYFDDPLGYQPAQQDKTALYIGWPASGGV